MYSHLLEEYVEYHEDLVRGRMEGLIVYPSVSSPLCGPYDEYSHLPNKNKGALTEYNSRPLLQIVHPLIQYFIDMQGRVRSLEIGQGAGPACLEVHNAIAAQRSTGEVHAVSFTPASPFLGLKRSVLKMVEMISSHPDIGKIQEDARQHVNNAIRAYNPSAQHHVHLRLDVALHVNDQLGLDHYLDLRRSDPYLTRQYIGDFTELEGEKNYYDIIYENYGALFHCTKPFKTVLGKILSHLSSQGVFIKRGSLAPEEHVILMQSFPEYTFICSESENNEIYTLITRKKSPLGQKIGEALAVSPFSSTFTYVHDFSQHLNN